MPSKLERDFQAQLIKELERRFPGCFVLKNDSGYLPGVPDLLILFGNMWAMLEVKPRKPRSSRDYEPNQEFYLDILDQMSFADTIYPENAEDVIHALQRSFQTQGNARLPIPKSAQLG